MLGTGPSNKNILRRKTALNARQRTVDLKISLPSDSGSAAKRLARKIQDSVSRTLLREGEDASCVAIVEDRSAQEHKRTSKARLGPTPVGCGAWWNF